MANPSIHPRVASEEQPASHWLHNMSSPPRTILLLRPLKAAGSATPAEPGTEEAASIDGAATANGLEWVMRIDLDQLIQSRFPEFDGRSGSGKWDSTSEDHPLLRLRCCIVLARPMNGADLPVGRQDVDALRDVPFETLCDELRELNATTNPAQLALPPMGLMLNADSKKRPAELNVQRVFYVLTRLHGTTFVRGASAMVAGRLHSNICLDLWLPI